MNYKTAILIRLFFLVLIVTTYTSHCNSQIVLSEIMFDPAGSEYYDEFIEIYNSSSSDTVDLEGWIISDGSGTDQIIGVDMGTRLPPNGYGIILDEGYFDNSTYYDSLIPGSALVLTIDNGTFGSSGLSNSTPETVFLISSFGDTVAAYQYSLNNDPGFSDEKIDLLGGDLSENWTNSLTLNGTPGAQNSVKRLDYDLALEGIKYSPCYPFPDDEITFQAMVKNYGLQTAYSFQLNIFIDFDGDGVFTEQEKIVDRTLSEMSLVKGDSLFVDMAYFATNSGVFNLLSTLFFESDGNPLNDSLFSTMSIGFAAKTLAINEIMYSPQSGQPEWIEVYNPQTLSVDLQGWMISDSDSATAKVISETQLKIPANSYLVLSADSLLLDIYDIRDAMLITIPGWQSLNNENDEIYLFDGNKNIIDNVNYFDFWGGDRGVSLERINFELSSNDSSNWGSSVDVSGATPGIKNSIFVDVLPANTAMDISPNPFSPDGDGKDDITVGVSNSIIWDGRNDKGNVCRMGIYIVFLEAIHYQEGVVKTVKKSVVLANKL
ncbi:hypothetical protein B6I21_02890 [candidate division KSB1 bacterium 4572_119]|nr:MAG: hypothetical protein B6I21_02890 [candidate division KSB1 bacterium 4572_119]